ISRNFDVSIKEIEDYVKNSKENGFGFVKILSIKSQKIFKEIDSLCKKYDMPMGGHFPRLASGNNLSEDVFFNSNYNSIEHLGGLVGEPTLLDSRINSIKKNNIYICPTLSWYFIGSGQYSYEELPKLTGMEYIPKATMQEWLDKTKQYRDKIGVDAYKEEVKKELNEIQEKYKVIARLQKEGVKMLLSPDASSKYMISGCNMITEMELLKNANLSNFEILQMATTNFADFYKENNGKIEVGKDADFIVLDKNPLENIETLKNINGLYFNQKYLSDKDLQKLKNNLLKTTLSQK
ncbi:MAG: amidohydrolase family protein, partial [Flavobacterium sp.]